MNEVFEKILARLEDVASLRKMNGMERRVGKRQTQGFGFGIRFAKEVVQEVAEEYNGGWIACSERLPEEYAVLCCDKYGGMIVGYPYFDEASNTNYSSESDNEMMYDCIAWQKLPEPYKN